MDLLKRAAVDFVDQRRKPREPLDLPVILTVLPNMEISIPGRLTDVSHSGLGLSVAEPVPPGTWIAAEWGDTIALGSIVYCIETNGEYHAGMRTDYIVFDRTDWDAPSISKFRVSPP